MMAGRPRKIAVVAVVVNESSGDVGDDAEVAVTVAGDPKVSPRSGCDEERSRCERFIAISQRETEHSSDERWQQLEHVRRGSTRNKLFRTSDGCRFYSSLSSPCNGARLAIHQTIEKRKKSFPEND
jgi:hypothetical protein